MQPIIIFCLSILFCSWSFYWTIRDMLTIPNMLYGKFKHSQFIQNWALYRTEHGCWSVAVLWDVIIKNFLNSNKIIQIKPLNKRKINWDYNFSYIQKVVRAGSIKPLNPHPKKPLLKARRHFDSRKLEQLTYLYVRKTNVFIRSTNLSSQAQ